MLLFPSLTLNPKPLAFKSGYVVIPGCADTRHHDIQDGNGFATGNHINDKLKKYKNCFKKCNYNEKGGNNTAYVQEALLVLGQHSVVANTGASGVASVCHITGCILPGDHYADGPGDRYHCSGALPTI